VCICTANVASREFTDSKGNVWRVWDVSPSYLHPITRSESFMEEWAGGWLAFECALDKRRYPAPYPGNWVEYDLTRLEALCRAAKPISARRSQPAAVSTLVNVEDAAREDDRSVSERVFTSPRGRRWTVRLHELQGRDGHSETVLRFSGGNLVVDLEEWPSNWKSLNRDDYARLLLDANPVRNERRRAVSANA
jgi:hypothetical protein